MATCPDNLCCQLCQVVHDRSENSWRLSTAWTRRKKQSQRPHQCLLTWAIFWIHSLLVWQYQQFTRPRIEMTGYFCWALWSNNTASEPALPSPPRRLDEPLLLPLGSWPPPPPAKRESVSLRRCCLCLSLSLTLVPECASNALSLASLPVQSLHD